MSTDGLNPDVVVVGMPSCGKTVFFTVLGKKFTNLIDGKRGAPLGFRLGTCDRNTASVVSVAYDRLRHGQWPEATKAGQIMPLRWEVFTGRRRIFELFSMDIAGETFKKTFDIKDDDNGHGDSTKPTVSLAKTQKIPDLGDELYRTESAAGDTVAGDGGRETDEEKAAGMLKRAIETAKVVCFMVNIALPDRRGGRKPDDADEKKLLRFRSSVLNMYLSLKENPKLRAKSMIVLTQAHRHQGEIERAGGPVMYLGDVCGGEASELSNLAKENDIPVIAVSAVNEAERGANELPMIDSPYDIPSSGLFGFLLAVSGMVAQGDNLVGVKDAYLEYQRERVEYLKCPSQMVKFRLAQAKKCQEASAAFLNACNEYLDDRDNLDAVGGTTLSPSAIAMYKRFTQEDPDVKTASDKEYIVRDLLWDRALRKAAVVNGQTTANSIYNEVREGLEKVFPDKGGNDENEEYVYGFGEEDLFTGSDASTFNGWIELNLKEYKTDLEDDIDDLDELKRKTIKVIASLATNIGGKDFEACLSLAEKSYSEFSEKLSVFRSAWLDNGNLSLPKLSHIEEEVVDAYKRVSGYKNEHQRCEIKRQIAECEKQLQNLEADVEKLLSLAGTNVFKGGAKSLEDRLNAFYGQYSYLIKKWQKECSIDSCEISGIETKYDAVGEKLNNAIKVDKDKTQKKIAAAHRLKGMVMLLLVLIIGVAVLFVARYYHDEKNKRTTQAISRAISRSEYANAKSLYDSLVSIKWLGVSNNDYLCSDFEERLALAAKYHDIRKSSEKSNSRLEGLRKWLDGIEASSEEVNNARKECDDTLRSYKALPFSTTFNEIVQQRVDFKSRILAAQACESSLKKSIDKIEKIQIGWKEYLRKKAFTSEMQEAERELKELNLIDNLNMASVSNSIDAVNSHVGKLLELAGSDDEDTENAKKFKSSADVVLERLKEKYAEQRNKEFDKLLADIRLAIVSNSVGEVWAKYDVAHDFSSNDGERDKLARLHEEAIDFTVKECERTLSEAEKTADMLRGEISISKEMLDGTCRSLKLIDKVRDGLLRRIPVPRNDFNRIESLAESVQAKLPVIVQIDGIRQNDDQPVNIKNAGRETATILNGTSPETQKQCVYFLVLQNELPFGSSRLVRVVDENGKTSGMSIRLSDLVPGINRFEKPIN